MQQSQYLKHDIDTELKDRDQAYTLWALSQSSFDVISNKLVEVWPKI
jgi:hypothetical protein